MESNGRQSPERIHDQFAPRFFEGPAVAKHAAAVLAATAPAPARAGS